MPAAVSRSAIRAMTCSGVSSEAIELAEQLIADASFIQLAMLGSDSRSSQVAKRLAHLASEAKAPHPAESALGESLNL